MVRTDLPFTYCHRKRLKKGVREYWRFRRDDIDTKLPGRPGDPAFHEKYAELCADAERRANKAEKARHTVDWLIDQYRASVEFRSLSGVTQIDYARTLERIRDAMGPERYDCVNRAAVKVLRDAFGDRPRTAHKIKQMVSALYSWADQEELVPAGFNPASGLKKIRAKVKPIEIWSDEEIALFLDRCEPFMRTPVLLALYTGQRREDIVQMDWRAVQGDMIRVRQNKTNEPLMIPMHEELKRHLAPLRCDLGKIVRNAEGDTMNANALSSALNRAVAAIPAMPHRTMHGLRYASAGRMEAAGCTIVQITSIIGHRTYQMALKYMRQRKDAEAAMARLQKEAS